jgi:hypothetical protein
MKRSRWLLGVGAEMTETGLKAVDLTLEMSESVISVSS